MGNFLSAIIVFVSVTVLTLFSFLVADFNHPSLAEEDNSSFGVPAWAILVVGFIIASGLAAWIVSSTRKLSRTHNMTAQLRNERDKLENLLVSGRKLETMAQQVGGIAHDFNNVLMTVSGYASLALAKNEENDDPEMEEYLNLVSLSADKGTVLIRRLMSLSRGKSHRRGGNVELVSAVEDAVATLRRLLPQNVDMQVTVAIDCPALSIDSLVIEQIITNLVINSRDAVGESGTIRINLADAIIANSRCNACQQMFTGEFVGLTVSDTGAGLSLDNIDEIFQPFYTTKTDGGGSGLGMALVQNLVHGIGGHIQVKSEQGSGTAVTVYLPSATAASNKMPTE